MHNVQNNYKALIDLKYLITKLVYWTKNYYFVKYSSGYVKIIIGKKHNITIEQNINIKYIYNFYVKEIYFFGNYSMNSIFTFKFKL